MKKISILIAPLLCSTLLCAQGVNANQFFIGGGLGSNDLAGESATGFQIFAGMPLPVKMGKAKLSAEVGYMDSGEFEETFSYTTINPLNPFGPPLVVSNTTTYEVKGLWANAVVEVPVGSVELIGRVGLDFGDDDGLMLGAGVGIPVSNTMDIRVEYVIRDHVDSLQANLVIGL